MQTPQQEAEEQQLGLKARILHNRITAAQAVYDEMLEHGGEAAAIVGSTFIQQAKIEQIELNTILDYMSNVLDSRPSLTRGLEQGVAFKSVRAAGLPGVTIVAPEPDPQPVPMPDPPEPPPRQVDEAKKKSAD